MGKNGFRITAKELADLLGVTPRTFTNWRRKFGFPKPVSDRGPYDLSDVLQWFLSAWKEASKPVEIADQEARLTKLKADEKEIKVRMLRGEVVDKDQALRSVERGISEAKGILLALVNEIRALSPPELREEFGDAAQRAVEMSLRSLEGCKEVEG